MRHPLSALLVALGVGATSQAAIINNPSFETIPGPAFGQGVLPSGWQSASAFIPGADTYSNDNSYGLAPGDFGNFPGVTANDGIRWVAGASFGRTATSTTVGGEAFGTTLAMTLTPGEAYQIDVALHQALRSDLNNPGGYDLFLATGNTGPGLAGAVLLGGFAPTTMNAWEARSLTFVAPSDANSRPFLIFAPYQVSGGVAYPGIDAMSLAPAAAGVPEPASLALFSLGGLVALALTSRRV